MLILKLTVLPIFVLMSVAKPSMLSLPDPSMPHSLTGLPTFWFSRTILLVVEAVAVPVVLSEFGVRVLVVTDFVGATALVIGPLKRAIWDLDGPVVAVSAPPGRVVTAPTGALLP